MKQMSVLALLFAALFLVFSTGTASAGWYGESSRSDMSSEEERSSSDIGKGPPDSVSTGSWQYEGPVETGTIPMGEDLSEAQSGVSDEVPTQESGGLKFREELDSGP